MKLSSEQINEIEKKLEDNNLFFLDYKIELQDHIACNIEELMSKKQLDFNQAFKVTFKKWEYKLKPHLTFFISNNRDFPKIISKKLFTKFLIFNTFLIVSVCVGLFIFMNIQDKISNYNNIFNLIKFVYWVLFVLSLSLLVIIFKKNVITSYSYMFIKHFPILLIFTFLNFFLNSPIISLLSFFVMIAVVPFLISSFYNHIIFIKKYKLV